MKIEDQVISLELAKRLKALNLKQESLFYWCQQKDETFFLPMTEVTLAIYDGKFVKLFSAFTVAELGEMLPHLIGDYVLDQIKTTDNQYCLLYRNRNNGRHITIKHANTEADARAKMLIYLIENKLITI